MSDTSSSSVEPPSPRLPEADADATAPAARLSAAQLEAARKVLQHLRPGARPDSGAVEPGGSASAR